jgi:GntR family transcriptional regulator
MTTTTKSGAGVCRYLRLYRVLSQALAQGRFGAGQRLPSEPRLMRDYRVSRSTVRRALARLEAEDRIERMRGSGTFARGHGGPGKAAFPRDLSPVLDAVGSPGGVTCRTTAVQRIAAPAFLAGERDGFGAGAVLIRRIRSLEREPVALETAYLPEAVGGRLTRRQLGAAAGAILAVLAGMGHRSASIEREFAAVEADPLAANGLRVAVGAPLLNVRSLARDPQHRIVAYVSCLYRPDRYEAHAAIEIPRPKRDRTRKRS